MQISDSVSNKHLRFYMPNNAGDTDGIIWPYNTLRHEFLPINHFFFFGLKNKIPGAYLSQSVVKWSSDSLAFYVFLLISEVTHLTFWCDFL